MFVYVKAHTDIVFGASIPQTLITVMEEEQGDSRPIMVEGMEFR